MMKMLSLKALLCMSTLLVVATQTWRCRRRRSLHLLALLQNWKVHMETYMNKILQVNSFESK